jgi:hypothetical protein
MANDPVHVMRTILTAASLLSMIGAVLPIAWGEVRVKWLVTGLMASVMFGLSGMMIAAIAPEIAVDVASEGARDPHVGGDALKLVGGVIGFLALLYAIVVAVGYARELGARRSEREKARATARAATMDPVKVAEAHAPEMLADVRTAVQRIDRLRTIGGLPDTPENAEALMLAEKRLPSLMERYSVAVRAADGEAEKADLARAALTTVVHIGKSADEARRRIADGLRGDLDTEARYISMRTGATALGLA